MHPFGELVLAELALAHGRGEGELLALVVGVLEAIDAGAAVLIVSSELEEVVSLGDRIAVMYQGKIVSTLTPEEATLERLGLLMGGAHPEDQSAEELQAAVAASRSGTDG